jgi:hypothetical protein
MKQTPHSALDDMILTKMSWSYLLRGLAFVFCPFLVWATSQPNKSQTITLLAISILFVSSLFLGYTLQKDALCLKKNGYRLK